MRLKIKDQILNPPNNYRLSTCSQILADRPGCGLVSIFPNFKIIKMDNRENVDNRGASVLTAVEFFSLLMRLLKIFVRKYDGMVIIYFFPAFVAFWRLPNY